MELRPGWKRVPLGEVVTLQRGFDLPARLRIVGNVPIVSSAGVTAHHNRSMVEPPGVATGRYGTIGDIFFLLEPFWPLNTTLYVRDFKGNDEKFIYFALQRFDFKSLSGKSGVPGVNRNEAHVEKIVIPCDSHEQRAIAKALGDVDELLGGLDRLIAKKRDLKQAAMQQLLSGQTRLPGFHGKLNSGVMGDLLNAQVARSAPVDTEMVTFLGMEDLSESGEILQQQQLQFDKVKSGLTYFERNDTLVAKITPCFENGKGALLSSLETASGFGSTEFHVLRARAPGDPRYVYFQTRLPEFRRKLEGQMIGTAGQKRVPRGAILKYELPAIHEPAEQTAIADTLSEMAAELVMLEQRREKTRALKQAMMQELLTGKTRLVQTEAAHA